MTARNLGSVSNVGGQVGGLDEADLVTWEAVYADGFVLREREGHKYADIDRPALAYFQLVAPGETLMTLPTDRPHGRTGENLVYRRRTAIGAPAAGGPAKRRVFFLIGFVGPGPIIALYPSENRYDERARFTEGDPDFYPPVPHPHEGEHWTLEAAQHTADAGVRATTITLPSGMKMDVLPRTSPSGARPK